MSTIATSDRLITLYYSSNSRRAKLTLAYAKSEGWPVQEIDILKTPLTGMQLVALAERLGLKVKDLVNQNHPVFEKKFKGNDFELSSNDWIKMIQHNPEIMKQPIAIRGDITILVETPSDIIKI